MKVPPYKDPNGDEVTISLASNLTGSFMVFKDKLGVLILDPNSYFSLYSDTFKTKVEAGEDG